MKIEEILLEAVPARIQHIEDLVLTNGYDGAMQGLETLENLVKSDANSATIKFDGKPAIIFGRNQVGEFILTDKSGFGAKTYNGKFKSIKELEKVVGSRKGEGREELVQIYKTIWPLFERDTPKNFRGFIQADLLYTSVPKLVDNFYIFTPNVVTYKVPVDSDLGNLIKVSKIGIAVHTFLRDFNSSPEPLDRSFALNNIPEVAIFTPWLSTNKLSFDLSKINSLKKNVIQQKSTLSKLLDINILKTSGIQDLGEILKKFVNSKVRSGNLSNYVTDFPKWLEQENMSGPKKQRCLNYFTNNIKAFFTVFNIFDAIMRLKNDVVSTIDKVSNNIQASVSGNSGGEGYVISNKSGPLKLVNRGIFSKALFNNH